MKKFYLTLLSLIFAIISAFAGGGGTDCADLNLISGQQGFFVHTYNNFILSSNGFNGVSNGELFIVGTLDIEMNMLNCPNKKLIINSTGTEWVIVDGDTLIGASPLSVLPIDVSAHKNGSEITVEGEFAHVQLGPSTQIIHSICTDDSNCNPNITPGGDCVDMNQIPQSWTLDHTQGDITLTADQFLGVNSGAINVVGWLDIDVSATNCSSKELVVAYNGSSYIAVDGDTIDINGPIVNDSSKPYQIGRSWVSTELYISGDFDIVSFGNSTQIISSICLYKSFCDVTSAERKSDAKIELYPNPASDVINLVGDYKNLQIFNTQGALVFTGNGSVNMVDVSGFTAGVYQAVLTKDNSDVEYLRFIVK